MNRRSITVAGLAAAAIAGSAAPAWSFWTLTSNSEATAGAKAATLTGNAPTVVSSRTKGGGVNLKVTFTVVEPPAGGAVPSSYRVERLQQVGDAVPVCTITGATGTCSNPDRTGDDNNGDKSFLVTALVGNWVSASSVCDYENAMETPTGSANFMCTGPSSTSMALRTTDATPTTQSTPPASDAEKKSKQSAPATEPSTLVVPAPPSAPRVLAADDSGSSDADGITNLADLRLVGTAEPGSTVVLSADGTELASTTASADGGYQVPVTLAEGSHEVTAVASTEAGESPASAASTVVIDRTAPALTIEASGSGTDRRVTGTLGTASGDAPDVRIDVDNGADLGPVEVTADGTFGAGVEVDPGTTRVTATQTDTAGNLGTAAAQIEATEATEATEGTEGAEAPGGEPQPSTTEASTEELSTEPSAP